MISSYFLSSLDLCFSAVCMTLFRRIAIVRWLLRPATNSTHFSFSSYLPAFPSHFTDCVCVCVGVHVLGVLPPNCPVFTGSKEWWKVLTVKSYAPCRLKDKTYGMYMDTDWLKVTLHSQRAAKQSVYTTVNIWKITAPVNANIDTVNQWLLAITVANILTLNCCSNSH